MTAPMDLAYSALCAALATALVDAGFIASAEALEIDPVSACQPSGDETTVQTSAQIVTLNTEAVRPLMGSGRRRYVVERGVRLELAAFGPNAEGEDDFKTRLSAALDAVAAVAPADPTLGQTCERLEATESEDDDLPPNGMKVAVTFTIRLRAGDPLGRTDP